VPCEHGEDVLYVALKRAQETEGHFRVPIAEVAELADALDSGSSALTGVRVQIPASAPNQPSVEPAAHQA
jgi:hypothetical protein